VAWSGFAPCEAIFFDLDDTLIDFDGAAVERCWQLACAEVVSDQADCMAAELRGAIKRVGAWYWADPDRHRRGRADLMEATRTIVGQALETIGRPDDQLARTLATRYRVLRDERLAVFPGVAEMLAALVADGYTLGMISNGDSSGQRRKLERFDLAKHFAYIGIEEEAGVGKPEPEAYWRALRAVDCAPGDAWMVGDNLDWDVIGAQQLGLRAVWIDRHRRGLPDDSTARPHHVATRVTELGVVLG
jgi:putative hydrolase of the HAD superfamily